MIQAVIFDMDGLMFDTERLLAEAVAQAGKELGIPGIREFARRLAGVCLAEERRMFSERYGPDFPFDGLTRRKRELMDAWIRKNGVPVKPGLLELLRALKAEGYRTAVATSTAQKRAAGYLEQTGAAAYLDHAVYGDMLEKSKPDPDIYLKTAAALGVAPEACMALEDSPVGIRSAHDAGMRTVMVPDLVEPDGELEKLTFACVPTLSEVLPLLHGEAAGA